MSLGIPEQTASMNQCGCLCHSTGTKHIKASNPPQPCCTCNAFLSIIPPGFYTAVWPKTDIEILLERIENLEKITRSNEISNFNALSERIEKLEQSPSLNLTCPDCKHQFKAYL